VWTDFCCPQCRGSLNFDSDHYRCGTCKRDYPVIFDIPDFRLVPDPYISFADEYEKSRVLADKASTASFESLVRFYWEITPDVPRAAVERYIRYALRGQDRGNAYLEQLDTSIQGRWSGELALEIGCGTGGFLSAAQHRFNTVVGIDIALRWLVVAKKRLTYGGNPGVLICCSAENLPFPDGTFDSVVGFHVLEHTKNQQSVLSETARTLKHNGLCFFLIPNRFSLGPEPCVRVWGVGFVPRVLAETYVRLIKGIPYKHIRLLSFFELRRLAARSGLRQWKIFPPQIPECELKLLPGPLKRLVAVYHGLLKLPFCSFVLRVVAPFLQLVGRR
jgi:SAM-dependent methyltransferase